MTQATAYEHVRIDESGVPVIEGTTMKVVELVLETVAYGWSPDEIRFQHPYLTLGQIGYGRRTDNTSRSPIVGFRPSLGQRV